MRRNDHRKISAAESKFIADFFQAIANPSRVVLLSQLSDRPKDFIDLLAATDLRKTALSNHLALLMDKRLIKRVSHGTYAITRDGLSILESAIDTYIESKHRQDIEKQKLMERYASRSDEKVKSELDVEIVELEPMTVASVRAISKSPEEDAWKKMVSFAEPRGLLKNLKKHPVFGFNNPNPSEGSDEYGYEFWIRIDDSVELDDTVQRKEFKGGLYAVTRCNLTKELQSDFLPEHGMLEGWALLQHWVKENDYRHGKHQWLEKSVNPTEVDEDHLLDLYMPIEK
ncbi:ArsR family transcriptional regulator [Candidatus Thorarchaeota archaeon]|nr:MAG: ArsR family transcriptional regulator [Candidatus Thorarchaeota archaeon]